MRVALVLIVASLALLLAPRSADAGSCGSDGGDSGSSSGSSDSGGDDGDSTPACSETSPVLGMTECSRYGSWDRRRWPRLRVAVGSSIRRISIASRRMSAMAEHPDASARVLVEGDAGAGPAIGGTFDVTATMALTRHLYVGAEGSLGGIESGGFSSVDDSDDVATERGSTTLLSASVVAGVAAPIGRTTIRGQVAAGVDSIAVSVESRVGDCVTTNAVTSSRWAVRPRVSVERWLSPWMTLGASVGTNARDRREMSVGVYLGGHLRAFQ